MFDTNVLISMFLFPKTRIGTLKYFIDKSFKLYLASYIIDELKDVVNRKFPDKAIDLEVFLQTLPFTMFYTPEIFDKDDYPSIRDDFDLPILVSAIDEGIDFLVTGDKDFLGLNTEKLEILAPGEFLNRIEK